MKQLLTILLTIISFGAFAQTYDNLPSGFVPYGTQYYKNPAGKIIVGTSAGKFRVVSQQKELDSLFALTVKLNDGGRQVIKKETEIQGPNFFITNTPETTVPSDNFFVMQEVSAGQVRRMNSALVAPASGSANYIATNNGSATNTTLNSAVIINSAINNTTVGSNNPASGSFTNLNATSSLTVQLLNQKGQNNGYASLDGTGKVPVSQMPDALVGAVVYQGNYDVSTNTPTLPAASGNKGKYYVISVGGSTQGQNFENGDWIISNGTVWQKVDNSTKVASVNGRTGAVTDLMDIYTQQTVTGRKIFTQYPLFENGASFLNGSGPTLYNNNNTYTADFNYSDTATRNTIYRYRSLPFKNSRYDIAVLDDFSSGQIIGANTTGNAATATDAAKWNGNTISSSTPTTGQFIVYNGSNYIPKTITATSPIAFNATTSDISLNVAAAKSALGINDGSALNNVASSATNWDGVGLTLGNTPSPVRVLSLNAGGTNAGYTSIADLKSTLGINNGSGLNNIASSATNWGGLPADFSANPSISDILSANPFPIYNSNNFRFEATSPSIIKQVLATSLHDVTNAGSTTPNPILITANLSGSDVSRFTTKGAGSSYFDLWTDANQSINMSLRRSDNANVFDINGHSMQAKFGGNVAIGTTVPASNTPFHVKVGTNQNLGVFSSDSNTTISAFDDAVLNNVPLRFRASEFNFTLGTLKATDINSGVGTSTAGIAIGTQGATDAYIQSRDGSVNRKMNLYASDFSFNSSVAINGNVTANNLTSGTYTPSVTSPTNTTGTTSIFTSMYTRVGNIVSVTGKVTLTKNVTSQNTSVKISLPISSNFDNGQDLIGNGSGNQTAENPSVYIVPDLTDKVAVINIGATPTASATSITYHFTYTIK